MRIIVMYDITELQDCYYTNATGTYNANLKTVTLSVTPTKSYECDVFPEGVLVTVKAFEIDHNLLWILDNFQYTVNQTLVLQEIDFGAFNPQMVQINISTVNYFTIVELSQLNFQLSALDQCFKTGTQFDVTNTQISLSVVASGACNLQMKYLLSLQTVLGDYSETLTLQQSTKIYVNGAQVSALDPDGTFPHYNENDVMMFYVDGDFTNAMMQQFMNIQITFNMKIDQLTVFSVVEPDIKNIGYDEPLFASNTLFITTAGASIQFQFGASVIANFGTMFDDSDQFIFRLGVQQGEQKYTLRNTLTSFSLSNNIISFDAAGSDEWASIAKVIDETATFQLDVTILNDNVLQQFFVVFPTYSYSCWENAVMYNMKDQACVHLVRKPTCVMDGKQAHLQLMIFNGNAFIKTISQQVMMTAEQYRYCFTCSDTSCSEALFNNANKALFKTSSSNLTSSVPVLTHAEGDYNLVSYISLAVGGLFALGSLVYLIIEFIKLKQKLKQMKVKKTIRKT
uniref:Uncharacterized protein n=1 Tax=Trepomonas sp. PC1 TaxID=1076344 RepID=A0A146KHA1_9EUKA|eukprot:JAP96053.1 Hypothetical protein TPC1_10742 [Trepomonas sp. PC1]